MKPKVLVVADANNSQTRAQIAALRAHGASVIVAPLSLMSSAGFSWDAGSVRDGTIDLSDVHAVLVRSLPAQAPGASAFQGGEDGRLDWAAWFQESCLQRDRHDTAFGFLLSLEARGVPMFNRPSRSNLSRRKPYQLSVLRNVGCALPRTLVTNAPRDAKAFLQQVPDAIVKPAAGGALTMNAHELDDAALESIRYAPAIFQERIRGQDLRVMVVDGEVVSCASIGVPADTIDFRGDADYSGGRISYRNVKLPRGVRGACRRIAGALGLRFAGIDIKHTSDGRMVFLECNSSPIYLDVERKLGHEISDALCGRVVSAARRYSSVTTASAISAATNSMPSTMIQATTRFAGELAGAGVETAAGAAAATGTGAAAGAG